VSNLEHNGSVVNGAFLSGISDQVKMWAVFAWLFFLSPKKSISRANAEIGKGPSH